MATLNGRRVRHTVSFLLRHPEGSPEEASFLDGAAALGAIPGVESFEILAEVSPLNGYRFGIAMEFADPDAYAAYDAHPIHREFVRTRWIPEVESFLEIDYAVRPA